MADPDPALLEPNPPPAKGFLPRIAPDGRAPMHEYAAGFDPTSRRPRVGLIVGGIGMNAANSLDAARRLPGGVTLAVSAYATDVDRILAAARIAQHEYLLEVPMEPQGFPANDPDDRHALMTSLSQTENIGRLHWALSRIAGYVGVTNAFGTMRGERLSGAADQFDAVLKELASRGLLFADARVGAPSLPFVWNRAVDIVIDDDPITADIMDQRLTALAKLAQERGSALGLVSVPRPMTLEHLALWIGTLVQQGLVLAPVSALTEPPGGERAP
ncbi:divergent polysaccharide deacetylase family protein [Rhodopila sp.]|uniref:divergent polysaccharide deacetylase family protein n=1 Tax=Rhodopila sp. TaxID=2480087 RepID=UPI002C42438F|nr:divergent polysaccharide deacetylase family protein [Rhodopila sp.]HVZ10506.1 divergent polysaccharide deacetylase family protein [Rhodopila sp.]